MSRTASAGTCSGDFLHKEAQTPLHELFLVGGRGCEISTNSESILEAARESFVPNEEPGIPTELRMRFWVDADAASQTPRPQPYVRGLDHLVFAGFETGSSALIDLRTRRVIGRFCREMAADGDYWKTVIFPMLLSVLAGSVGFVELHASCVAKGHRGLILIGPSRSGKSTLAMALAEAGFRFLSDDRTFCSLQQGELLAWGMPRPLKLRREAGAWFEEFRNQEPRDVQNGELVFRFEPNRRFGGSIGGCEPRLLVFLERQKSPGFRVTRMPPSEAGSRIEQDLMAEAPEAVQKQADTVVKLVTLPCWRLQYGGRPQVTAEQLADCFEQF